jgi:hypothetical protein
MSGGSGGGKAIGKKDDTKRGVKMETKGIESKRGEEWWMRVKRH